VNVDEKKRFENLERERFENLDENLDDDLENDLKNANSMNTKLVNCQSATCRVR
jgi:ribosomal protein S13